MVISITSDNIRVKANISNPSQAPLESSKAPKLDLKGKHILCTFEINLDCKILNIGVSKTGNHIQSVTYQDLKDLQLPPNPALKLKGHGCSLHLQNQFEWPQF